MCRRELLGQVLRERSALRVELARVADEALHRVLRAVAAVRQLWLARAR